MITHTLDADLGEGQESIDTPHGKFKLTNRIVHSGRYRASYVEADQFATATLLATQFDILIKTARKHLAAKDWRAGAAVLYDAEAWAYRHGLDDEAMKCRQAVASLSRQQIPDWLKAES